MSLQGLVSGSECALPNNPLAQVLKHTDSDHSVQRDRIAGPSSSRLHHLPSTSSGNASETDLALAQNFFSGSPAPGPSMAMQHPARHTPPLELLGRMDGPNSTPPASLQEAWVRNEMQKYQGRQAAYSPLSQESLWSAEFGSRSKPQSPGPSVMAQQESQSDALRSIYSPPQQQQFYQPPMSMGMYGAGMNQPLMQQQEVGKGKGRIRDEDFEAAFAQYASHTASESAKIEEVHDGVTGIEESMQRAALAEPVSDVMGDDFQKVWDNLQMSDLPPSSDSRAKWEAEFNQLMSAQREDGEIDYATAMQEAWEGGMGNMYGDAIPEGPTMTFNEEGIPILGDYVFERNNKYLASSPSVSHLDQAKRLLEQNGSLTEVALLLEAAIQKNDLGKGGYEAWILLGETRSMDEREEAGMRALQEGVRRAQEAGAAGEGMLSLAISYTNESYDRASNTMLLRWLETRFPNHASHEAIASLKNSTWNSNKHVKEAFLNVARHQHSQGIVDPDVQTGLGVLFYSNGDYELAKDCFGSALSARPKDYLLWNRLGSSLSNGNKPEEALGAYREALHLRPTYTRAIYNVGVACLNIGAHKEAAEHFLSALALQDTTEGEKSEQLWHTLRRAFQAMERRDLVEIAKTGAKVDSFRAHGFDF